MGSDKLNTDKGIKLLYEKLGSLFKVDTNQVWYGIVVYGILKCIAQATKISKNIIVVENGEEMVQIVEAEVVLSEE